MTMSRWLWIFRVPSIIWYRLVVCPIRGHRYLWIIDNNECVFCTKVRTKIRTDHIERGGYPARSTVSKNLKDSLPSGPGLGGSSK